MVFAGDLDEDQQGVIVSIANFSSQSNLCESFYKESELLSCFSLGYAGRSAMPIDTVGSRRTGSCEAEDNDIVNFHVCLDALFIVLESWGHGRR